MSATADAFAAARETPRTAFAPRLPLFGVPSRSISVRSSCICSNGSSPISASCIGPLTAAAAFRTPLPRYRDASPSRRSTASNSPVDAPEGTAARPIEPSVKRTSASTVGLPRESSISRPVTFAISIVIHCLLSPVRCPPTCSRPSFPLSPFRHFRFPCRHSRFPFRHSRVSGNPESISKTIRLQQLPSSNPLPSRFPFSSFPLPLSSFPRKRGIQSPSQKLSAFNNYRRPTRCHPAFPFRHFRFPCRHSRVSGNPESISKTIRLRQLPSSNPLSFPLSLFVIPA